MTTSKTAATPSRKEPLGIPKGSVRAILALGVVGAAIAGRIEFASAELVLAFYFMARR